MREREIRHKSPLSRYCLPCSGLRELQLWDSSSLRRKSLSLPCLLCHAVLRLQVIGVFLKHCLPVSLSPAPLHPQRGSGCREDTRRQRSFRDSHWGS